MRAIKSFFLYIIKIEQVQDMQMQASRENYKKVLKRGIQMSIYGAKKVKVFLKF
jgi:hypothetical protein